MPLAQDLFDALVDEARMRIFRDDYPEIVDQLIELFVDSTPPPLAELRECATTGDGEAARRTAYKLKGSRQNTGAAFMAKLAHDAEQSPPRPRPSWTRWTACSPTRATRCGRRRRRTGLDSSSATVTLIAVTAIGFAWRTAQARDAALACERRMRRPRYTTSTWRCRWSTATSGSSSSRAKR